MSAQQPRHNLEAQSPAAMDWTRRADRPAGVFASYAGPVRERARVSRRSMLSIYVLLLTVTAIFGVLAAYQWERAKDAAEQAELIADQNEALARRVKDLEHLGAGLADMVALAYQNDPHALLAQLDDLEERLPEAAASDIFTRLWLAAKDRENQDRQGQTPDDQAFETASGGDPTVPLRAPQPSTAQPPAPVMEIERAEIKKAEPVPQDQPKADAAADAAQEPDAARTDGGANVVANVAPNAAAPANIVIAATQETWIQILDAEGAPLYTRLMKPGERTAAPQNAAMLVTGNPTGLTLSVNDAPVPAFNPKGPTRREIALDAQRLMDGSAELPAKRSRVAE